MLFVQCALAKVIGVIFTILQVFIILQNDFYDNFFLPSFDVV